jgi:predicted ATPase
MIFHMWTTPSSQGVLQCFDQIACVHMSGLFLRSGFEAWMAYHIALLARACEIAGQVAEGLTLLDEALQVVKRTGERWLEAELNRHKGQLLLRQGHPEGAGVS